NGSQRNRSILCASAECVATREVNGRSGRDQPLDRYARLEELCPRPATTRVGRFAEVRFRGPLGAIPGRRSTHRYIRSNRRYRRVDWQTPQRKHESQRGLDSTEGNLETHRGWLETADPPEIQDRRNAE